MILEPGTANRSPPRPDSMTAAAPTVLQNRDPFSINHLPPEVLVGVIQRAAPSAWVYRGYYKSLFQIRGVCKYWMNVVDSTPNLWTSLWTEFDLNLVEMILVKSKHESLSIWYDDREFSGNDPVRESQILAFFNHVTPSSRRWKVLHYCTWPKAQHQRLLGLPLDQLGDLVIVLSDDLTYTPSLNTPKLSHLCVRRCSLNWHSISGLRSLVIIQNRNGLGLDELMAVLCTSPDLEELRVVRSMMALHRSDDSYYLPAPIILPKLKRMVFSQLPGIPLSILLDQIEAPNLQVFSYAMTFNAFLDDLLRIFGSAGRYIGPDVASRADEQTSRLAIVMGGETLRIEVGNRKIIAERADWAEASGREERVACVSAALAQFHPNFCRAVRTVSFQYAPWSDEVAEHLRLIHTRLPRVMELALTGPGGPNSDIDSIVGTLSPPQDATSGKEELFPCMVDFQIRSMRVGSLRCSSSIIELARRRAESAKVATLKTIGLPGCKIEPEAAEELQKALRDFREADSNLDSTLSAAT